MIKQDAFERISREGDVFFTYSRQHFLNPMLKMMRDEKQELYLLSTIQRRIVGTLTVLAPEHAISVKELSANCNTRKSQISPELYALEQKGYVSVQISQEDRRVKLVQLTPKGRAMCDECDRRSIEISREYFGMFRTEEEISKLADCLQELNKFWMDLDPDRYFLAEKESE